MLTAIVLSNSLSFPTDRKRAAEAAARSLAPLVSAAVRGLVHDAVIAGEDSAALRHVADYAGCKLVTETEQHRALEAALACARAEHVLVLAGGYAVEGPLADEIGDFLEFGPGREGTCGRIRAARRTWITRIFPQLSHFVGLVAPRTKCQAARARDVNDLAKRLRPAVTLRASARRIV
ncbi:MAG: hypothetical protein NVSMB26_06420 [Beijerinckiaceae bacterium]